MDITMTLFYGPPSCHRPRVPCRKKRCRRRRPRPKPTPPPSPPFPPIGQRTQIAFVIKKYQFSGLSLFDGNSNADITGATSIPGTPFIQGNRGAAVSGYSQQLPFVKTGNAVYTAPTSNNFNKLYNPTFAATNSGLPIPWTHADVATVIRNLSILKRVIWKKWLGATLKAQKKSVQSEKFQQQLLKNYGSGFEIESYLFSPNYPDAGLSDALSSVWTDTYINLVYKFQLEDDIKSVQFTTDAESYSDWVNIIPAPSECLEKVIGKFISTAISASGWVNTSNDTASIPITLLTGVMLPSLELTSAGSNTAQEFAEYVQKGYTVDSPYFREYQLGNALVTQMGEDCVTVEFELPSTAPEGTNPFEAVASQFIRGNDGQFPVSVDQVTGFIQGEGSPFAIPTAKSGGLTSNPWGNFLPNFGPAYSAALLTPEIQFPIVWYVPAYVDPFYDGATVPPTTGCPGCEPTT